MVEKKGVYFSSDYDPSVDRAVLGLDGHAPLKILNDPERKRIANKLWQLDGATREELEGLGFEFRALPLDPGEKSLNNPE